MRRGFFVVAGLLLGAAGSARGDAAADWQQIEAMETNAPAAQSQWKTRAEAQAGTIEYLGRQKQELLAFIASYPQDAHVADAKMRLAHLLATLGDLEQEPRLRREAEGMLDELEQEPGMRDRRADVEFARVSLLMQQVDLVTGANRDTMLEKARAFAKEFPDDRRVAALLAEVASAFEDEPKTACALLEQARPKAQTDELRARIDDDLKRLALLGKPLAMRWTSVQGTRIDLDRLRGKVVLIYFFASWSPPSIAELAWVQGLSAASDAIQTLGICLDNDPVAVPWTLAGRGIEWPVYCDGKGWQGELARSLGINALPQLWIVDSQGILRSVDAKQDAEALIEKAARGKD